MAIQVKLDTSANPPVTVVPSTEQISTRGNNTITWVPFAQQNFTFVSLSGLPNPPFSTPTVTDSQITVTDNNQAAASYEYTIVVSSNGVEYSSAASMRTRTASTSSTIKPQGIMSAGSPTIQNK